MCCFQISVLFTQRQRHLESAPCRDARPRCMARKAPPRPPESCCNEDCGSRSKNMEQIQFPFVSCAVVTPPDSSLGILRFFFVTLQLGKFPAAPFIKVCSFTPLSSYSWTEKNPSGISSMFACICSCIKGRWESMLLRKHYEICHIMFSFKMPIIDFIRQSFLKY